MQAILLKAQDARKVTAAQRVELMGLVDYMVDIVIREAGEKAHLRGRLRGMEEMAEKVARKATKGGGSGRPGPDERRGEAAARKGNYVDAVRGGPKPRVTGAKGQAVGTKSEVVISMEGKDADEVKCEIKKVLDLRTMGIRVKKVLKIRRGVVIELESKGEVEKVKESETLRE